MRQLFTPGLVAGTLLLWLTFFMSLLVFYLLTSWLPTLLNSARQTPKSASLIALVLPIGSTVGSIGIGLLMDRFNPHVVLFGRYTLAAAFILLLGLSTASPTLLVLAVSAQASEPGVRRSASTLSLRPTIRRRAARRA